MNIKRSREGFWPDMVKHNSKRQYVEKSISKLDDGDNASQIHVLAVDDSFVERRVIEKLLKTSSFKVTTVESASKALEVLGVVDGKLPSIQNEAFEINLIITDYCMPGMTGFDLLKKQVAALKKIPVVVMSSENVPNRIKMCLAEGAEEFIIKPVQLEDVKRLEDHVRYRRTFNTDAKRKSTASVPSATNKDIERMASASRHNKRKISAEEIQAEASSNREKQSIQTSSHTGYVII
ncbi:hypothetical protein O6H91_21G001100 [Diphasiastrum complanatum]|uniref:Uncharacterized protein n=1 Tax=Diphasiastrum complanatum TaxID=34168 RepID=A0ACC2AH04_DIPCM|nr:hypothetical protein O6H91_21G001100 [Diphasiastrum complanatum]